MAPEQEAKGNSGACNHSKEKQLRELADCLAREINYKWCVNTHANNLDWMRETIYKRVAAILSQPEPQDTELRRLDGIKVMKMEHLPAASIMVSPDVYETMKQEIARAQAPQSGCTCHHEAIPCYRNINCPIHGQPLSGGASCVCGWHDCTYPNCQKGSGGAS